MAAGTQALLLGGQEEEVAPRCIFLSMDNLGMKRRFFHVDQSCSLRHSSLNSVPEQTNLMTAAGDLKPFSQPAVCKLCKSQKFCRVQQVAQPAFCKSQWFCKMHQVAPGWDWFLHPAFFLHSRVVVSCVWGREAKGLQAYVIFNLGLHYTYNRTAIFRQCT